MLILLMLERGGLSQNANTAETKEGRVGRVSGLGLSVKYLEYNH